MTASYTDPLTLAQLRQLRAEATAEATLLPSPGLVQWMRQLATRIRAAEVAAEPGLHHLLAVEDLEREAAERGPQSTAWQALKLVDEVRARAAWRRYWGRDCRADGAVVVR